jgi:hypothetical protein
MAARRLTPSLDAATNLAFQEQPMNHQIDYLIAKARDAELQRASAHARLARDVLAGQRNPHDSKPITRLSLRLAGLIGRFAATRP